MNVLYSIIPLAYAATVPAGEPTIQGIISKFETQIAYPVISLMFILATIVFLWGIVNYVVGSGGNDKKLEQGKKIMLWGIIGMAIMASAWGLVGYICDYFGTCGNISVPSVTSQSSSGGSVQL